MFLRPGTYEELILKWVGEERASTPRWFAPDHFVLDLGCHIGVFSRLAADRKASAIGCEANRENDQLACMNTANRERVTIRHAAVWRSDRPSSVVHFEPSTNSRNTGGGSVLFPSEEAARSALARERATVPPPLATISRPLTTYSQWGSMSFSRSWARSSCS